MLGEPCKGDIFLQRAMIIEKIPAKVGSRANLKLHVSDENGVISEPQIPGVNLCLLFEDNFSQQFAPEPQQKEVFIGKVQIYENNPEEDMIFFHRLDAQGKKISILCREKKKKFFKTHFLEIETMPSKQISSEDEEIIDLEEEVN